MMKFTMISLAMFARWSIISGVIFFGGVTAANGTVLIEPSGMCGPNCVTYRISLAGPIDNRMLADFTKATEDPLVKEEHEKHIGPIVSLNSPGGSIVDAMAIGNLIRSQGYITFVFEENECSSACVLVLAAGVKRFVPSKKIGVHRPHFDEQMFAKLSQSDARKKYEDMAEGVRKYLTSMGMSESLYPAMLRVSSDRIKYLSYIELKSYGLEGEDAAFSEWERARAIQMLGGQMPSEIAVSRPTTPSTNMSFEVCSLRTAFAVASSNVPEAVPE